MKPKAALTTGAAIAAIAAISIFGLQLGHDGVLATAAIAAIAALAGATLPGIRKK